MQTHNCLLCNFHDCFKQQVQVHLLPFSGTCIHHKQHVDSAASHSTQEPSRRLTASVAIQQLLNLIKMTTGDHLHAAWQSKVNRT